jgi:hypothetical protein
VTAPQDPTTGLAERLAGLGQFQEELDAAGVGRPAERVTGSPARLYATATRVLREHPALAQLLQDRGSMAVAIALEHAARAVVDALRDPVLPRALPTGSCWCGCGTEVGDRSLFARGHDKLAGAALEAAEYEAQVARMLAAHGYGPGRSVTQAAVDTGRWERCGTCGAPGHPATIRLHQRRTGHTGVRPRT